jgi:hypothetical protein
LVAFIGYHLARVQGLIEVLVPVGKIAMVGSWYWVVMTHTPSKVQIETSTVVFAL